ncbi:hypothetical protein C5167_011433 [Papaver somniferum]|uniref:O-fucosyltransferase family protein n=1 Tax=Papaver somniferum TaxID=3469 RepID=A0A4Y7K4A5_PAPSO|nr:O-fucosyltransferase 23-like [Papaver somniferum]XP_026395268.1 O-fucosyltransferase 23-like [Papaver somniferum]RZC67747.1 hypothetical protein C5167_011433 [Papaver somniferum]
MNLSKPPKHIRFLDCYLNSKVRRCLFLISIALIFRALFLLTTPLAFKHNTTFDYWLSTSSFSSSSRLVHDNSSGGGIRSDKFLEVPQIAWGLNNQKIAVARAFLTARMLNRTLLLPSLSASLFYKEVNLLQSVTFDKIFQFDKFNSLCNGFVQLGRFSDISNKTDVFDLNKGSGRKWTMERDLDQLRKVKQDPSIDGYEVIRILGKNPFLWHDHWPVRDYANVFECLVLVDEITQEAERVVSKIREIGSQVIESKTDSLSRTQQPYYVAVHMRIEKDWMIHCKKLQQRNNVTQICSSKEEIMERVGNIVGINQQPTVVYLAVADDLLEDGSVLSGWKEGLLPYEKKKLGVWDIYKKYPYLIQSAIDYEVCLRADVFVGNSYSTFSSLIVLERSQKLLRLGAVTEGSSCTTNSNESGGSGIKWPSYAYNILGESGGPKKWMTNMSDTSLQAISYGSNDVSC